MAAMWSVIAYTVLTVAAFYFILLQPVLKKQKEAKKAVRELRIGDEVITTGGLIGEVKDVITPADGLTEIILELAPGVRVRATTDAISERLTTLEPAAAAAPRSPDAQIQEAAEPRA